jgi:hypothetical protein
MPLCQLAGLMARFGLAPAADAEIACSGGLGTECPVYLKISGEGT